MSSSALLDLFERLEYDYVRELSRSTCIRCFRKNKECILLDYFQSGERFIAISRNQSWKRMKINPEKFDGLITVNLSDSHDGFILVEYPENDDFNMIIYEYQ
jgi:hypothetical protein